jgi:uncharacterized protein (DUF1015 family)
MIAPVFMATIKPFAALRPKPELAAQICELPYDVMSSDEARVLAAGNPLSFLHVSKPEIDLPPDTDIYADAVYARGRENFERLITQGALRQDDQPCFYLYRQVMGTHAQVGLVAAASCQEYLDGSIKKHEFTRPDKEDDRVRHIEALNSQTGPVFLTYRAVPALNDLFEKVTAGTANVDFTAPDGVRHTIRKQSSRSSSRLPPYRSSTSPTDTIAARRPAGCFNPAGEPGTARGFSPSSSRTTRCRSSPTTGS